MRGYTDTGKGRSPAPASGPSKRLLWVVNGHAEASEAQQPFGYPTPRARTVLMLESWLRHEAPVNAAKSERISISFNYA